MGNESVNDMIKQLKEMGPMGDLTITFTVKEFVDITNLIVGIFNRVKVEEKPNDE